MHSQVSVNGNKEGVPIGDAFLYRADRQVLCLSPIRICLRVENDYSRGSISSIERRMYQEGGDIDGGERI